MRHSPEYTQTNFLLSSLLQGLFKKKVINFPTFCH